jgi:hypothetical protein
MGEEETEQKSDGKSLFIIRNGQKIAQYEDGKWVPLLRGVVVRTTPDGIKIEMPNLTHSAPVMQPAHSRGVANAHPVLWNRRQRPKFFGLRDRHPEVC